jgi:hypothetical protein
VLSIMGLTWQNIRQKLVKAVGETVVKGLETGFDIVVALVTEGPAAAIIDAIIATYNTVMFFIERMRQMIKVVAAFIDSLAAITAGVVTTAANKVEETMGGLLTLAISFLARLAGLGKVSDVISNIVTRIRAPIDKALDKVVEWIVTGAKKVGKFFVGAAKNLAGWWRTRVSVTADGTSHQLYFQGEGAAAKLMVASTPLAIDAFLAGKKADAKDDPAKQKAISAIESALGTVRGLVKKAEAAPEDVALQKQIEETLNAFAPSLIAL